MEDLQWIIAFSYYFWIIISQKVDVGMVRCYYIPWLLTSFKGDICKRGEEKVEV